MLNTTWTRAVEHYYDETTDLYLSHIGSIFQAGILVENNQVLDPEASAVALAERAGITDGNYILDAGCGVGGVSIALAKKFKNITIEAITNSSHQVEIGRENIRKNELSERIHVHKGDFHKTQFVANSFDIVLFFESFGHSDNFEGLLREMHRVLKPGGHLYMKDVFSHPLNSDKQKQELEAFNKQFFYNTSDMPSLVDTIGKANFEIIRAGSLDACISHEFFRNALYQMSNEKATFTQLGEKHNHVFTDLPIYFGEILAKKI